ncbi:MAG TPA: hypothetical protein VKG45_14845 [Actinomycetes bacterium]|nr:hypothetical protein [Actinomycetes bacterium]
MVLIAALVPRALADISGDGVAFDDMFQFDPPTAQEPPIAAANTSSDGGDDDNEATTSALQAFNQDDGTPQTPPETPYSPAAGDDLERTEALLVATQVQPEGQQPEGQKPPDPTQDDSTPADDQLTAAQDQLSEPGECAGGGCPKGIAIPKDVLTAASTGTGSSRGGDASGDADQPPTEVDRRIAQLKARAEWMAERLQSPDPPTPGQASRELKGILRQVNRLLVNQPRGSSRSDRLEEVRQKTQEELDKLQNPMVAVDLDDTRLPGYGQVERDQVPKLPGTTATKLDITTSVMLIGGTGLLLALSYVYPPLRLALMQGGLKGGLNAVPLLATARPMDG